jgi:hypothetical protein
MAIERKHKNEYASQKKSSGSHYFYEELKKFKQRGFNKKFSNRFVLKPSTTHGKKKSTHPHMCP